MTSVGVWACQWRELKPINFGTKAPPKEPTVDDGEGESRGRGRGRGRDGAGEYEMVDMNERDSQA